MLSNEIHFTLNPYWMHTLTTDERDELQKWLIAAGVNLNLCPGFDYDPINKLITTRYYETFEFDTPMIVDGQVLYEDQVREFQATYTPEVVGKAMLTIRGS